MALQIIRAKPNPAGRDRFGRLTPSSQLAAEWIDIANTGVTSESLTSLTLYHKIFNDFCIELGFDEVISFRGILGSGEVVRIHSGGEIPLNQMYAEDVQGVDHHLFTGTNYLWNNKCGDTAVLYNTITKLEMDRAYYDSNPPEGKILRRIGNKLI